MKCQKSILFFILLSIQRSLSFWFNTVDMRLICGICLISSSSLSLSLFLCLAISMCQNNGNTSSVAAVKEQLTQLLCATRPSVLLSCRPAQASQVKVSVVC